MKTQELLYTEEYWKERERRTKVGMPKFFAGLKEIASIKDPKIWEEKLLILQCECFSPETEAEKAERVKREIEEEMMCQRYHDVLELILEGDLKVFKKLSAKKNINH